MARSITEYYRDLDVTDLLASAVDEVVTHSYVRKIPLPLSRGTLALITLDNGKDHTRPNTLGPQGLMELKGVLDELTQEASAGDIQAVAITGSPFILAAGADLSKVGSIPDRHTGALMAQLGHQVLGAIGEVGVPSFVFINGLALGGGLEVALNADYRTVSQSAAAIALPEVFLGLVPGWGGAWLLPNLIGIRRALTVMIENPLKQNRTLSAQQAYDLGIADAIFPAARFLEDSVAFVDKVLAKRIRVTRKHSPSIVERHIVWPIAVKKTRQVLEQKIGTVRLAPFRALELMDKARHTSKLQGFQAEDEVLADLIASDQFRASVYAFMLVQKRQKNTPGAPDRDKARPITKVGVVGAGLMARQIAASFLRRLEVPVVISDIDETRVTDAVEWITGEMRTLHKKGRIHSDVLGKLQALITGTTSLADFADCDLVIEAVFEEMSVKQTVFSELEKHVSAEAILASNTSSLSIADIAQSLMHPKRMVGIHFFNPVAVMPLVEVVKAPKSSDEALATALSAVSKLKKTAIITSDTTGFVVNRLLAKLLGEAMHAIEEGCDYAVVEEAVAPLGLPMGPFELLELVGLQVGAHVLDTHHKAFPDRFFRSDALHALVKQGRIFERTAKGDRGAVTADARALIGQGPGLSVMELRERVHLGLADEVWRMLEEGVVSSPEDVDVAMLLGAGWPLHMGGVTPYLDRTGSSEKVRGTTFHTPMVKGVS